VAKRRGIAAIVWLVLAIAGLVAPGPAGAQSSAPKPGDTRSTATGVPLEDRDPKLANIERHHGGSHVLAISKSTLKVSPQFDVLVGDAAQSYFALKNSLTAVTGLEAVLVHLSTQSTVYVVAQDTGYVALDDWASVDPAGLLNDMRSHHSVTNIETAPNGLRPLEVLNWRQTPELDRRSATVFWSVNTTIGGKPFVQATLLELGRHGIEKLDWIGNPGTDPRLILNTVAASLSFAPDERYQDHRADEKVTGSGIDRLLKLSVGIGRTSMIASAASLEGVQTAALGMVGVSAAMFVVALRLRAHQKKLRTQKDTIVSS
jgi:uncharacterized membrane-anchored protein